MDKNDDTCNNWTLARIFDVVYVALVYIFFIMSLTKPIEKATYTTSLLISLFCSLIAVSFIFGLLYFLGDELNDFSMGMIGLSIFCVYLMPILIRLFYANWFKYLGSVIKYIIAAPLLLLLSPFYNNILLIFAISNVHDISWGRRTTNEKVSDETKKNLEQFRAFSLIVWISINTLYAYGSLYLEQQGQDYYIFCIAVSKSEINYR